MTNACFDTEWDRWCGLFQVGRRSKAAYFVELRHLTDQQFRTASRAAVQSHTSRTFPTVGELLSHVPAVSKSWTPAHPIRGASKDELQAAYERLEGFYELAQMNADMAGEPNPKEPAVALRKVVHRALQKMIAVNAEALAGEFHRNEPQVPKTGRDTGPRRGDLD